jgi:hypothetical protein
MPTLLPCPAAWLLAAGELLGELAWSGAEKRVAVVSKATGKELPEPVVVAHWEVNGIDIFSLQVRKGCPYI